PVVVVARDHDRLDVQHPVFEPRLVEDAEVLLPSDDRARVVQRFRRVTLVRVPDRGVHEVVAEDHHDLEPPVDDRAVAQPSSAALRSGRRDLGVGSGRHQRAGPAPTGCRRLPTANAGAPSMLTMSTPAYQSRPTAIACALRTPNGWRKSTSIPSRTPSPPIVI